MEATFAALTNPDDEGRASIMSRVRSKIVAGAHDERKLLKKLSRYRSLHKHWITLLKGSEGNQAIILSILLRLAEGDLFKNSGQVVSHIVANEDKIGKDLLLSVVDQERFEIGRYQVRQKVLRRDER